MKLSSNPLFVHVEQTLLFGIDFFQQLLSFFFIFILGCGLSIFFFSIVVVLRIWFAGFGHKNGALFHEAALGCGSMCWLWGRKMKKSIGKTFSCYLWQSKRGKVGNSLVPKESNLFFIQKNKNPSISLWQNSKIQMHFYKIMSILIPTNKREDYT